MMDDWVELDGKELGSVQKASVQGVNINVLMSPHDLPQAVRGFYDTGINRFVIEFRYIGEEAFTREPIGDHMTARVGRHSRRLYGIEVNVQELKTPAVGVTLHIRQVAESVQVAIDRMANAPKASVRRDNYNVAKKAIATKHNRIFESLQLA